jgi:hypothetical protein
VNDTLTQTIRLENEPINNADMEHTIMTGLPLSEQWDGKADKYAYGSFTTPTEKRWKRMFIASR